MTSNTSTRALGPEERSPHLTTQAAHAELLYRLVAMRGGGCYLTPATYALFEQSGLSRVQVDAAADKLAAEGRIRLGVAAFTVSERGDLAWAVSLALTAPAPPELEEEQPEQLQQERMEQRRVRASRPRMVSLASLLVAGQAEQE